MPLEPGSTLGPYTILAELGHGGMGAVYTAHDPRLDRQVAIKVLPPDLTRDATAKQRFLQEAKAGRTRSPPVASTTLVRMADPKVARRLVTVPRRQSAGTC